MAKAKQKSTAELKDLRAQLEIEVNEAQKELAEKKYSVNLESIQNINAILKQIDKNYEWSIKNAAFVINLYDALADQKRQFQIDDKGESTVQLNGVQLNQLYTIITNITGTGIEGAKTFTRLLTKNLRLLSDTYFKTFKHNASSAFSGYVKPLSEMRKI